MSASNENNNHKPYSNDSEDTVERKDYSRYRNYENEDDDFTMYDSFNERAWIKIDSECVFELDEMS